MQKTVREPMPHSCGPRPCGSGLARHRAPPQVWTGRALLITRPLIGRRYVRLSTLRCAAEKSRRFGSHSMQSRAHKLLEPAGGVQLRARDATKQGLSVIENQVQKSATARSHAALDQRAEGLA